MSRSALFKLFVRFGRDCQGTTAIEYSVLIGMIFVILVSVAALGGQVSAMYNGIAAKAAAAMAH